MEILNSIINDFDIRRFVGFFRGKHRKFAESGEDYSHYRDDENIRELRKVGEIEYSADERLIVLSAKSAKELTSRSGKKIQYEIARKVLKTEFYDAGIFIFHDDNGNFRFSLVYANYFGTKREYSNFRRFTYFVSKEFSNKTFLNRVGDAHFANIDSIKDAFSVEPVNREFYSKIQKVFYELVGGKIGEVDFGEGLLHLPVDRNAARTTFQDFAVRLLGRTVFCWFLKKKMSGKGIPLVPNSILSSEAVSENSGYYHKILEKLFFQILNTTHDKRNSFLPEGSELIPFLNGGLFEPKSSDFYEEGNGGISTYIGTVKIPDKWFAEFFSMLEEYNFTIDENSNSDAEVSIDPEILGRIFENLLAEIDPDTGATARNATGSFYTPREIVEYMVEQSLIQYLQCSLSNVGLFRATATMPSGKPSSLTNKDKQDVCPIFRKLLSESSNDIPEELKGREQEILKALSDIKILDPACGSGAFPVGILQKIVHILQKIDPGKDQWLDLQLDRIRDMNISAEEQDKRLNNLIHAFETNEADYGRKLGVIRNSVYGIDIQTIAVEISKLRFFLSLIVDENIFDDEPNRGIEPLPNLEFKFVAANSLISAPEECSSTVSVENLLGLQFDEDPFFANLAKLSEGYFYAKDPEKKRIFINKIDVLISEKVSTKLREYEKEKKLAIGASKASDKRYKDKLASKSLREIDQWESYKNLFRNKKVEFFDTKYFFPDVKKVSENGVEGYFDIVLGNPPYVQIQKFSGEQCQKDWENENYATFAKTGDIYCLFYEKGCQLLKPGGHLCYITSNKWMRAGYGQATREFFTENVNIRQLIDFGDAPVFESATTYTNILIFAKEKQNHSPQVWDVNSIYHKRWTLERMLSKSNVSLPIFSEDAFIILPSDQAEIKERVEELGIPLKDWDVSINYGIKTGYNEAFIIDGEKKDELIAKDSKNAEIIKPILRGRDIKKYSANFADLWLMATLPALNININEYPHIQEYLKSFGKKLNQTGEKYMDESGKTQTSRKATGNQWFETQDQIAYHNEFEKEKIVWAEIVYDSAFYFDDKAFFPEATVFIMTGECLKYITALLNSNLLTFAFKTFYAGGDLRGNTFRYKKAFLEHLPILKLSEADQKPFETLVDCILFAKEHDEDYDFGMAADTFESVIDGMVYDLYFEKEMKESDCYISDRIKEVIKPFKDNDTDEFKREYIEKLYDFCCNDKKVYHCLKHRRFVKTVKIVNGTN